MADKERAKALVVEMIRQAGGEFRKKTNLYKAFYRAHLHYAANQPGYLSDWPIVRMPQGPGIDQFDILLGELLSEGLLETSQVEAGDKMAFLFTLTNAGLGVPSLPTEALESIKAGIDAVVGKTAGAVSEDSHRDSRSWRRGLDGEELNIYIDLLAEDEYERLAAIAKEAAEDFAAS